MGEEGELPLGDRPDERPRALLRLFGLALAAAIDRALAAPGFAEVLFGVWGMRDLEADVAQWLEEVNRADLAELAAFCREGGFAVD